MSCCKLGCTETEIIKSQEIAFRNLQGYIVRTKIGWYKDHQPECILNDFTNIDLLKDKGGGY